MELLSNDAPINNLLDGDKTKILEIYDHAKAGTLTKQEVSELFRLTQQNFNAFGPFQMALILRIAEVISRGDNLRQSCNYISENISAAYRFYY